MLPTAPAPTSGSGQRFRVDGMDCASCARTVEKAVAALDGVRGAEKLTVKDLEALGPGLLIDQQKPDGDRVLVWTE
jgi:hypothetical protein